METLDLGGSDVDVVALLGGGVIFSLPGLDPGTVSGPTWPCDVMRPQVKSKFVCKVERQAHCVCSRKTATVQPQNPGLVRGFHF